MKSSNKEHFKKDMIMKKKVFATILISISIFCEAQIDEKIIRKIDTVFSNVDGESPGYMIAVANENKVLFKKGYGLSNLEHTISIDSTTNFNIASLSKQITGASVALLLLDKKIHLDDFVSDYLNGFPFSRDSTRIKHLIYMTSGINDYHYNPRQNKTDWSSLNFFNIDTAIAASYASGELMYKPGSQWSYSNINYMLLTKIVEKVSGISFSEFVEERIFKPLGMNHSVVNDDIFEVIPNRALGYNYRSKEETNWIIESGYLKEQGKGFLQIHRNSPHYGGSGVYTTMDDWMKWVSNFYSKKIGGQEFYDLMHKTMKFEHEKSNDAFGLVLDKHEKKDIVWYEGGDWGFSSFMVRFPEEKTTIVCFSNIGTGNTKSKVWGVYNILKTEGIVK